ncbi:MAG: hypothetical protein AAF696_27005 [Bacteroidota bacterium]
MELIKRLKIASLLLLSLLFINSGSFAQMTYLSPPEYTTVKNRSFSSTNAIFLFTNGTQKLKLELTKSGKNVVLEISSRAGNMGRARVGSNANGEISIRPSNLKKGTLGLWAYATICMETQGDEVVLVKPKKGAIQTRSQSGTTTYFADCNDRCKHLINAAQGAFAMASHSTSDPGPIIPVTYSTSTFATNWEAYYNCMHDCMAKF